MANPTDAEQAVPAPPAHLGQTWRALVDTVTGEIATADAVLPRPPLADTLRVQAHCLQVWRSARASSDR